MKRWWCLAAMMWIACGCDCAGDGPQGPCDGPRPPEGCDVTCSAEEPCAPGLYCGEEGVCTADCDPLRPAEGCPDGICRNDGRCEPAMRADGGRADGSNVCADVQVQATRVTPNVILIVDQSGSMTERFGDSNRWDALRDSLLADPGGLVTELDSIVRFGLALYSAEAPIDFEPVPGECPLITWVPPDLNNHGAIAAVYRPADPIDETPTGASIDWALDRLTMSPDPNADPTIFILATDGEPDTCEQPNPQNGQGESLAAVERAYLAGIRTYIISVGRGTVSEAHLQDMANAGLGREPGDPDAQFWEAGDDEGLRTALMDIVGGQLSCVVELQGRIDDLEQACSGRVELNGLPIPCNDPDGWRAIDESHIELRGDSCETLQSGPGVTLNATFPCGIILI